MRVNLAQVFLSKRTIRVANHERSMWVKYSLDGFIRSLIKGSTSDANGEMVKVLTKALMDGSVTMLTDATRLSIGLLWELNTYLVR